MALHTSRKKLFRILKKKITFIRQIKTISHTGPFSKTKKAIFATFGLLAGSAGVLIFTLNQSVKASVLELHPPSQKWSHNGLFASLDHASLRRGYEVYKQACAACHSLRFIAYRNLVNVTHSEEEAKAEAEEQMIVDGPDENGNMYERPGKLSDYLPCPYPNEQAARAANNGSYPSDLSYIVLAKIHGEDYIFALLTGYCEAPAGVVLREGQYYNPYFIGGSIAMAQPLYNESVSYTDGTIPSASQLAKDVTVFLKWAGEPEFDDRKLMMIKMFGIFSVLTPAYFYLTRMRTMLIKARKFEYRPKN